MTGKGPLLALDAMGTDAAPRAEIEGAIEAARDYGLRILLVGDEPRLKQELGTRIQGLPIAVRHASQIVTMEDHPAETLRRKRDSSIRIALELVKNGEAEAMVSAGNSGAVMATAAVVLRKLDGIERPAIAGLLPNRTGHTVVLDIGANVDCRPLHLAQFAAMGAVYARFMLGERRPRVGILSNGTEDTKGNLVVREAHQLLKSSGLAYEGYVEGRDVFNGSVDVVVCDGFVGNVLLKSSEGLASAIQEMLKSEIKRDPFAILGFLFLSLGALRRFRKRVDHEEYGGAPLLGVNGCCIIAHGSSSPRAVRNALLRAHEFVTHHVNLHIIEELSRHPGLHPLKAPAVGP